MKERSKGRREEEGKEMREKKGKEEKGMGRREK